MTRYEDWVDRMETTRDVCLRRGGTVEGLTVDGPASAGEVAAFEERNGLRLPDPFRDALLEFSAGLTFGWSFDDGDERPPYVPEWGLCEWSLDGTEVYTRAAFADLLGFEPDDPEGAEACCGTGEAKVHVVLVPNGDMVVLDVAADGESAPVLYVSHEGEPALVLAPDFAAFMDRWTRLGCVGPESWELEPFLSPDGLAPDGEAGLAWRRWCGLA